LTQEVFAELDEMARARLNRRGIDPDRSLRQFLGELIAAEPDSDRVDHLIREGCRTPLPLLPDEECAPADVTPAEVRVLTAIARGHTAKEVAHRIGISPHTAREHVKSLRRKLGAKTAAHAVAIALVEGVIGPEDVAA
jgi:DNA-binding CsgD family transcriptional regulator